MWTDFDRRWRLQKFIDEFNATMPALLGTPSVDVGTQGAVGDGVTDDTAAFQAANAALVALGGGRITGRAATYLIDPTSAPSLFTYGGVRLGSKVSLTLDPGAVLQAKPNAADGYAILQVYGSTDVYIGGGLTLRGDRSTHLAGTGEWGHGLMIWGGATRVTVENVVIQDTWGDGVYLGASVSTDAATRAFDVTLRNVRTDNCRRNGGTGAGVKGLAFASCRFANTNGIAPQAGFDFEADHPNTPNENITWTGLECINNNGAGIGFGGPTGTNKNIRGYGTTIVAGVAGYVLTTNDSVVRGDVVLRGLNAKGTLLYAHNLTIDDFTITHDGTFTQSPYAFISGGRAVELRNGTIRVSGGGRLFYAKDSLTRAEEVHLANVVGEVADATLADHENVATFSDYVHLDHVQLRYTGPTTSRRYSLGAVMPGDGQARVTELLVPVELTYLWFGSSTAVWTTAWNGSTWATTSHPAP